MTTDQAIARSVKAILHQQQPGGALPASPDFSQYGYCWLRDGSFTAYALDSVGEHHATHRFFAWAATAIDGSADVLHNALARKAAGKPLAPATMPPARFTLAGGVAVDDWPNYQIDGYGTWLWALGAHLAARQERELPDAWRPAAALAARYLDAFSFEPCYDVWEESGGLSAVHTSTLACIWAGLMTAAQLLHEPRYAHRASEIDSWVRQSSRARSWFPKSTTRADVDASTIWLSAPLCLIAADDRAMAATVAEVERTLTYEGGVRRFSDDSYFGGGAWPVLTCSLGLHYVRAGRIVDAQRCLDWTLDRFSEDGRLGEQFFGERRDPERYQEWVAQWGPPAAELLWSHAMLILLARALECAAGAAPQSGANDATARLQ